jgi:hypothetical protein
MARLSDRQLCGDEFGFMSVADGSASDSRARGLTAAEPTPALRGQTADFSGWHWCGRSRRT